MRTLLLFRGAPGCGKSTFIKNNGLEGYTLSADSIRTMCCSPILDASGNPQISQKRDKIVWEILFQMLESRMQNGDFTVIDATNSKTQEMNRYKKLADQYRYRIYIIDMTNIPIEECKKRNANRTPLKRVPESVIDNMYSRFATQKIPSGITKVSPENFLSEIEYKPVNLNYYKKVHIIGDIHGCNSVLQEYITSIGGIKEDEFYIFCGDYIDRGIENAEVLKYLISIMNFPNVCLLEGNHERWLSMWSHDQNGCSKEFEFVTKYQLIKAEIDKKQVRQFYRKLRQCSLFEYKTPDHENDMWFVSHAGISMPYTDNHIGLLSVPTSQMIHGAGEYKDIDKISESWSKQNWNQVFGHRNIQGFPIDIGNNCYDLENQVEFGGHLRSITLSHEDNVLCVETKNNVYKISEDEVPKESFGNLEVKELVDLMRKSRDIKEKQYGNISSFNFTRKAFENSRWNEVTIRARGLFIDTLKDKIVSRGYEKFFRVNEREETRIENLQNKFVFPVTAYVKENGSLCLISYDEDNDTIRVASKSSVNGPYSENMKKILSSTIGDENSSLYNRFKDLLKELNITLACEMIDPEFDPHIIEYKEASHLVLLDAIKNKIAFETISYEELCKIADQFKMKVKVCASVMNTWEEFYSWYCDVTSSEYKFNGQYIEGFVIEDSNGFMVKIKTEYYSNWKFLRSIAKAVGSKGYILKTSALITPEQNLFYGFLRDKYNESGPFDCNNNIIKLRNEFLSKSN